MVNELKSWCLSKLQNIEVRFAGDPRGPVLQRSSSMTEGLNEANVAGLSVLPPGQGGSSQCLEVHSSEAQLDSAQGEPSVAEGGSANHYFVVHVESSPGMIDSSVNQCSKFCRACHAQPDTCSQREWTRFGNIQAYVTKTLHNPSTLFFCHDLFGRK